LILSTVLSHFEASRVTGELQDSQSALVPPLLVFRDVHS
jgi:hypothetical protein